MAEITGSIRIAAAPAAVFAFASNPLNELQWNPEARSITQLTPGPVGVGTRFAAQWKGSPRLEVECLEYDAPHRWTHHNGGALEVTSRWTCTPTEDGTALSGSFRIDGHGIGRVFAPLIARRMRRLIPANLEWIRVAVESEAARIES